LRPFARGAARPDGEYDAVPKREPGHQPRIGRARSGQHLGDERPGPRRVALRVRHGAE
jgi:hypothetical protein